MGTVPYDAEPLSNSMPEEICKTQRIVTVNVVMKSRMWESPKHGSERISHRGV